jgi:DNA-binding Lrp family transcriptional regulator
MDLDAKDHKIIEILRKNSRETVRDISKKTGIRPSTVHQRITKMIQGGIIERFTLKLNNKAVGENFIVFMYLTTSRDLPSPFFNSRHIKDAFGVTGEYDLFLKLKFKDIEDFNKYVINLRKNRGIKKTLTTVATITLKEEL